MYKSVILILALGLFLPVISANDIIDLSCENDTDCEIFWNTVSNSSCVSGQCQCVDPETGNKTLCKPMVSKASNQIGGICPCIADNSFCHEKTQLCVCKEGFQPNRAGKKCISKSVPLGEPCEIDEQCIQHDHFSRCDEIQHNCTCSNHFVIYMDTCHSIIATGNASCEQDTDCSSSVVDSVCHDNQCICDKGFVANAENTSCLIVAQYEQPCIDSNQCIAQLGVGSLCKDAKCVCNEQYFPFTVQSYNNATAEHKVMNVCTRKITHGSSCNDSKDCYQFHRGPHEQNMECFLGECVCSSGSYEKDGVCVSYSSASVLVVSPVLAFLVMSAILFA
ncbi:prion-like-(Q/N-rich) domain-bearing protein 25 [Topomyia yanbarensis]|uniref:prion-like-(Q/N-rich) domain-bearing protein 25 n=1 Tax=Topomyia yanbarensis TaxID=2498891 RepID=UPI00273C751A|nr:prion-like-(Q/N-rich) domain-bearing protein 25 [Topomyia yanbarensis]XP_058833338.1 prion-like-(Q/N-rich) domain-bearing protein 25 [Topomyia yanbarensis]